MGLPYWDEIRLPTEYQVAVLSRLDRIIALLEQQQAGHSTPAIEGEPWANSNPSPAPKS